MWILMVEALGAGGLLVLIVWWTMFAGRDDEAEDGKSREDVTEP